MNNDFTIVFKRRDEQISELEAVNTSEATGAEIDEIAELRQAILDISEPPPASYTIS